MPNIKSSHIPIDLLDHLRDVLLGEDPYKLPEFVVISADEVKISFDFDSEMYGTIDFPGYGEYNFDITSLIRDTEGDLIINLTWEKE